MFDVPEFLFPFLDFGEFLLFSHGGVGFGLTEVFVDFSEFDAFDIFVLLFEEELFSLIFLIFFSSASELLIDGIELFEFGLIDGYIFLLAVFDESFEVSFSFVKFESIGLFVVVVGVIVEDLMVVVEL